MAATPTASPMVFQFIGDTVSNATNTFVAPAAGNLITALAVLATSGLSLYFTLTGYAIMTGAVEAPFWTFVKQSLKSLVIVAFALSATAYTNDVMGSFDGLETGLSAALNSSNPVSVYQTLDQSLGKGLDLIKICAENADTAGFNIGTAMGWLIAAVVIAIGTTLVTVIGGAVIIVAKFALAVMFAVGPLFIMALLFPVTARFFDSWFSQVMNYTLTIVIYAVVMAMAMAAYDAFISSIDLNSNNGESPMWAAVEIGALTGVLVWIILQISHMASGLAGGVSMAAMGIRHLISPVTGGLSAAKTAGNIVNPVSTRRDLESGMMTSGTRFDHMVAGNTIFNPAYSQHVLQNAGKNWGWRKGGSVKN
jgi:type IV secretion system protein VirB6